MGWRDLVGAGLVRAGEKLLPPRPPPADTKLLTAPPVEAPLETSNIDHLSQLFYSALAAETPRSLIEFVEFCSRFRRFSIFNARLIQAQRQGARVCATQKEWRAIGRYVLPDARPIIIM